VDQDILLTLSQADNPNLWLAFALTLFAGLATSAGAAAAIFAKRDNTRWLALGLAFSAGVMLYVSFTEILGKGHEALTESLGEKTAGWALFAGFFGGIVLCALLDRLTPSEHNPHEPHGVLAGEGEHSAERLAHARPPARSASNAALLRMGLFTAFAISLHNFPEGLATFFATLDDPKVGVAIAIAIALHNIPEGVSVAIPIYYATGSRKRAFWLATLSGLAEPVGAIIGYALLAPFITPAVMGTVFAVVAGIMVFISLDELLPTARAYAKGHEAVYGIFSGMAVMALSLLLLK
jgi:zinc transporter, ZIP family